MEDGALWTHNGGNLQAVADQIASGRHAGALIAIEVARDSLESERKDGPSREAEREILMRCWETAVTLLPNESTGKRSLWNRFEFVVEGDRQTLVELANRFVDSLTNDRQLGRLRWHVILTNLCAGEAERTFMCDPGYDLQALREKTALVWVEPYAGADWREAQRYPSVTTLRAE